MSSINNYYYSNSDVAATAVKPPLEPTNIDNVSTALFWFLTNQNGGLNFLPQLATDPDKMEAAARLLYELSQAYASPTGGGALGTADNTIKTLLSTSYGTPPTTILDLLNAGNPTMAQVQALQAQLGDQYSPLSEILSDLSSTNSKDPNAWWETAGHSYDGTGTNIANKADIQTMASIIKEIRDQDLYSYQILAKNPDTASEAKAQLVNIATQVAGFLGALEADKASQNPMALIADALFNQPTAGPSGYSADTFYSVAQAIANGTATPAQSAEFVTMLQPPNNTTYGNGGFGNDFGTFLQQMCSLVNSSMFSKISNQ